VRAYETILSGDLNGDDVRVWDPVALPNEPSRAENSYVVVYGQMLVVPVELNGLTITGGNANGPWHGPWINYFGGGVLIWDEADVRIVRCKIVGNSAAVDGGGIYIFACSPKVEECIIEGNYAGENGGGLCMGVGSPLVRSCVIRGNKAGGEGGAIYNHNYCSARIRNCTVLDNSARWYCGGMKSVSNSLVTVNNCIFRGNSDRQIFDDGSRTTVVYSNIEGGRGGAGNIDADPLFERDGYHLKRNSPCINAGDPNYVAAGYERDIDMEDRVVLGRVDMGADEWRMGVIYVDADAPGANNGSSWADAFTSLQDGLAVASRGVEIKVADGIYRPDQGSGISAGDRDATFALKERVCVYGGYGGFGSMQPDARDVEEYETVLSGDLNGDDAEVLAAEELAGDANRAENSYHVVTADDTDDKTVLDGFTISGGNANGLRQRGFGGGMTNKGGRLRMANCTFVGNSASLGGGIDNRDATDLVLLDCGFISNAAGSGAGMRNSRGSAAVLRRCSFRSNLADEEGGAIASYGSDVALSECLFCGNSANGYGGGMFMSQNASVLSGCTVSDNSAGVAAGGIYGDWMSVNLSNSIVWGNSDANGVDKWSQIDGETMDVSGSYNCVHGWAGDLGGAGNIDSDPRFVEAGYRDANGVWVEGNYHLLASSPCANAGDPDYAGEANETDLDGGPRVVNGRINMGAYESSGNAAPTACITGGDRTVEATGPETEVVLDGSCSGDADSTAGTNDDIVGFNWYEGGNLVGSGEVIGCDLGLGEHLIVLEVTDKAEASDTDEVTITVEDTTPPVITLNGSGTVMLECGVDNYVEEGAGAWDICDGNVAVIIGGDTVDTSMCGTYEVSYDAGDASGNQAEQILRTVIVEDTTLPEFSLVVEPNVLWPPNNKMVLVAPGWEVSDKCDEQPEVSLVDITMSAEGDVNDYVQIDGDGSIYLRATKGQGRAVRIYTVTYEAVDDSGNFAVDSASVVVPHNRR
jgi:hypothetical protein